MTLTILFEKGRFFHITYLIIYSFTTYARRRKTYSTDEKGIGMCCQLPSHYNIIAFQRSNILYLRNLKRRKKTGWR